MGMQWQRDWGFAADDVRVVVSETTPLGAHVRHVSTAGGLMYGAQLPRGLASVPGLAGGSDDMDANADGGTEVSLAEAWTATIVRRGRCALRSGCCGARDRNHPRASRSPTGGVSSEIRNLRPRAETLARSENRARGLNSCAADRRGPAGKNKLHRSKLEDERTAAVRR